MSFKVGDKVRIKPGAKVVGDTHLIGQVFTVKEMEGTRRLILDVPRGDLSLFFAEEVDLVDQTPSGLTISQMVADAYRTAKSKGFHDHEDGSDAQFGLKLALIHSEVSEALEERRNSQKFFLQAIGHSDPSTVVISEEFNAKVLNLQREAITEELADVVIRIADLCGVEGYDLEAAIVAKMKKNEGRPHMHGGKKF